MANKLIKVAIIIWVAILLGLSWQIYSNVKIPDSPSNNNYNQPIVDKI